MTTKGGQVEKALRSEGVFPPSVMDPHYGSKAELTRTEIVLRSLEEAGLLPLEQQDSQSNKQIGRIRSVVAGLQRKLPEGEIVTCGAFKVTGVTCCNRCHCDPLGRMKLVELPDGRKGWLCCALEATCSPLPSAGCHAPELDPLEGLMPRDEWGEEAPGGSA